MTILPGIEDEISYHTLAQRVLAGHGFSFPTYWWPATRAGDPTAHWSFLYTLYLVGVYALVGVHPLVARLIQAIVAGALQPWLAWRLGGRIFGQRAGLIAAALTSVYTYYVYYAGALMTETFYILAVLWALDLATTLALREESPSRSGLAARVPWLMLGLAFGIAALLRQLVLFLVPVVFAWLLVTRHRRAGAPTSTSRDHSIRTTLAGLAFASTIIAALILPWTVRNYRVFHRFVLLNTNAGYALFWANNPIYGTNFVPILPAWEYQALIPSKLRVLDEAALDQALMAEGLHFVVADPGRYVLLSLSRVKAYFEFWPSAKSGLVSNVARTSSFGILVPFILYGLYLALQHRRRLTVDQRYSLGLVSLFAIVYTLMHLLSWALIRYRLPVDAILILFAAFAVEHLVERFGWRVWL